MRRRFFLQNTPITKISFFKTRSKTSFYYCKVRNKHPLAYYFLKKISDPLLPTSLLWGPLLFLCYFVFHVPITLHFHCCFSDLPSPRLLYFTEFSERIFENSKKKSLKNAMNAKKFHKPHKKTISFLYWKTFSVTVILNQKPKSKIWEELANAFYRSWDN